MSNRNRTSFRNGYNSVNDHYSDDIYHHYDPKDDPVTKWNNANKSSNKKKESQSSCCTVAAIIGGLTLVGVIMIYIKIRSDYPVELDSTRKYIGYVTER